MKALTDGYTVQIDGFNAESWDQIIGRFDDANIYQTWAYGEIQQGLGKISHLILRRTGETLAAAQIRLFRVPLMRSGFAYVRCAPLWKRSSGEVSIEVFRQVIRALRNEYVCRRGMILRLLPRLLDETGELTKILQEEGFSRSHTTGNSRTLLMNLSPGLDELRKGLGPKWRGHLKRAEKNDLKIICGSGEELFDQFMKLYDEMWQRKRFVDNVALSQQKRIQAKLPPSAKMRILICCWNDKPCAAAICSAMGKTGIFLFGASNELGRETRGSYLIQWRIVQWLKTEGCTDYDLHGINPILNPGTYSFKAGLCGKENGRDVTFLGSFDSYKGSISSLALLMADRVRYLSNATRASVSAQSRRLAQWWHAFSEGTSQRIATSFHKGHGD
jgi:hypothetical protein